MYNILCARSRVSFVWERGIKRQSDGGGRGKGREGEGGGIGVGEGVGLLVHYRYAHIHKETTPYLLDQRALGIHGLDPLKRDVLALRQLDDVALAVNDPHSAQADV